MVDTPAQQAACSPSTLLGGPSTTTTVTVATTNTATTVANHRDRAVLTSSLPLVLSLETILGVHCRTLNDQRSPLFIRVDKTILWQRALTLYKGFKNDRRLMYRQLSVEFCGEDGIDAGAPRLSFFELLMCEVNKQLFEGFETKRILKKDWGLSPLFEVAGIMVAHSILNGAPVFLVSYQ